jgi:twinkle protein
VVSFPFFRRSVFGKKNQEEHSLLSDGKYEAVKIKLRGASKETKKFQRFKPTGGYFGVFGLNTLQEDSKVVVITEGEFDAMAVYQATHIPAISLPNGASNLPVQLIKLLEGLDRIYLWMDSDEIG